MAYVRPMEVTVVTYREQLEIDIKTTDPNVIEGRMLNSCPWQMGYEVRHSCDNKDCIKCWERQMSEGAVRHVSIPMCPTDVITASATYQEGYAVGKVEGVQFAWQLARTLYSDVPRRALQNMFGTDTAGRVIKQFTPEEVVSKFDEYEGIKYTYNSFKLGEVVILNSSKEEGIIIAKCEHSELKVLMADFDIVKCPISQVTKTGKCVDLEYILQQMITGQVGNQDV